MCAAPGESSGSTVFDSLCSDVSLSRHLMEKSRAFYPRCLLPHFLSEMNNAAKVVYKLEKFLL